MEDDLELLRRYVDEKSDEAFAVIVRRHIDLVYSVAQRQVGGDAYLAEDVTQVVFAALARKAPTLAGRPALAGWLYRSAHFAASDVVRAERRRRAREQEAHAMTLLSPDASPADWEKVRPVLDAVIAELDERDRDAVALRFFEGRSFAEVGVKLQLSENAARMRLDRALDKLHTGLGRRGVTSTVGALGLALAQQAGLAAPSGLAAAVTGAALAGVGSAMAVGGAAVFMTTGKLSVAITAALALAGTCGFVVQARTNAALQGEVARLRGEQAAVTALRAENARLAADVVTTVELRRDDAELENLQAEAEELKARLQVAVRLEREAEMVYEPSMLTRNVQFKSQAARLVYPTELHGTGIGGFVILRFVVTAEGRVKDVIVERTPHPKLGEAAVASVSQWTFLPGRRGDVAVNSWMRMPVKFVEPNSPPNSDK